MDYGEAPSDGLGGAIKARHHYYRVWSTIIIHYYYYLTFQVSKYNLQLLSSYQDGFGSADRTDSSHLAREHPRNASRGNVSSQSNEHSPVMEPERFDH